MIHAPRQPSEPLSKIEGAYAPAMPLQPQEQAAVIAFAHAPPQDGGHGAVLVYAGRFAAEKNLAGLMAAAAEEDGQLRTQPVFCLLRTELLASLTDFTQSGGRKVEHWTGQHRTVVVPFDRPGDDRQAFFNANTLAELQSLEGD